MAPRLLARQLTELLLRCALCCTLLKKGTDLSLRCGLEVAACRCLCCRLCRLQLALPVIPALLHLSCHAPHVCHHLPGHCTSRTSHGGQRLQKGQHVLRLLPARQDAQALQKWGAGTCRQAGGELIAGLQLGNG